MASLSRFVFALLLALVVVAPTSSIAATPPLFTTESSAQAYCLKDVVVWLNILTEIYHEKGMRWYGRTKNGAYVCRKEADAVGDRDTRNGKRTGRQT
jgi:hypothetical protein